MTKIWILSVLVVIGVYTGGCETNLKSAYRHPEFELGKRYRVAVLPFGDAPRYPGSGGVLTSLFETAMLTSGKFELVERGKLDSVLRERRQNATGEIEDPVAIGKLVRADLVIVGKVTNWTQGWLQSLLESTPTSVGASIKAISVEKGVIFWALDESTRPDLGDNIPLDGPVDVVARKLCQRMVATLAGTEKGRKEPISTRS